jgi:hypothetical protein
MKSVEREQEGEQQVAPEEQEDEELEEETAEIEVDPTFVPEDHHRSHQKNKKSAYDAVRRRSGKSDERKKKDRRKATFSQPTNNASEEHNNNDLSVLTHELVRPSGYLIAQYTPPGEVDPDPNMHVTETHWIADKTRLTVTYGPLENADKGMAEKTASKTHSLVDRNGRAVLPIYHINGVPFLSLTSFYNYFVCPSPMVKKMALADARTAASFVSTYEPCSTRSLRQPTLTRKHPSAWVVSGLASVTPPAKENTAPSDRMVWFGSLERLCAGYEADFNHGPKKGVKLPLESTFGPRPFFVP